MSEYWRSTRMSIFYYLFDEDPDHHNPRWAGSDVGIAHFNVNLDEDDEIIFVCHLTPKTEEFLDALKYGAVASVRYITIGRMDNFHSGVKVMDIKKITPTNYWGDNLKSVVLEDVFDVVINVRCACEIELFFREGEE